MKMYVFHSKNPPFSLWCYLAIFYSWIVVAMAAGDKAGGCVYSFEVWNPGQDVLRHLQQLDAGLQNVSHNLGQQLGVMENKFLALKLDARNASHSVEKEILELKLADVQMKITHKDMKLELMEMRNDNKELLDAVKGYGASQPESQSRGEFKLNKIRSELDSSQTLLARVKNGVGDLKAEWLLIKREVQDIKSENTQLKFGHNDMKEDATKMKTTIEELLIDTEALKVKQDEILAVNTKLKKSIQEIKGGQSGREKEDSGTIPVKNTRIGDLEVQADDLDQQVTELQVQNSRLQQAVLSIASKSNNISKDDIQKILLSSSPTGGTVQFKDPALKFKTKPKDCQEVYERGYFTNGVYEVQPPSMTQSDSVYCEMVDGKGWTLIHRRLDGTLSFNRRWLEYKYGFGNPYGEFWQGNEYLNKVTGSKNYRLRIDMWDWEGHRAYAEYSFFRVDSDRDKFKLHVRDYSGNAGDSMSYHDGMAFSTEDSDNDLHMRNCAVENKGGWWFNSCYSSNLNGIYHTGWYSQGSQTFADGIVWYTWKESEFYSLKKVEMKIRPA